MTRTNARELAVQLIFMKEFQTTPSAELQQTFFESGYYKSLSRELRLFGEMPNRKQREYICALADGVQAHRDELDGYISRYSVGWKLERISPLCRAVMRVSMYEILYQEDVPDSVAIHEAVELVRRYEDEDAVAFVNGLLGSFVRGLRA